MEEKKFCSHCGAQIDVDSSFCPKCGSRIDGYTENQSYEGEYQSSSTSQPYEQHATPSQSSSNNEYNTLTLVMGILAVVLGGLLFGILGIVFSSKADKNDAKTKIGKVLSIIGIVVWVIVILIWTILIIVAASTPNTACFLPFLF